MDARIDQVVTTGQITVDDITHETENNTYVLGDDDEVIVIDPGHDAAAVLEVVGERQVLAVICTHGHPDHVAAALAVAERDEAPIALHPKDRLLWRDTHPDDPPEIEMSDGGIFGVADVQLEVIHSPGHTPGSVALLCEDLGVVFAGDALTARGPCRFCDEFPDFPGQLNSIGEHLLTLPPDTRVLPGHGGPITVAAAEKKFDSWVTAGPEGAGRLDEPDEDGLVEMAVEVDEVEIVEIGIPDTPADLDADEPDDADASDDPDAPDTPDELDDEDDQDDEPDDAADAGEPAEAGRGRRGWRLGKGRKRGADR